MEAISIYSKSDLLELAAALSVLGGQAGHRDLGLTPSWSKHKQVLQIKSQALETSEQPAVISPTNTQTTNDV